MGPAHLGSPVVLFPQGRPVQTEAEGGEAAAQTQHRGGVLEAWAGADLSEQDTPSSQTPASHRAQTGALGPVSHTGHFMVRPRAQTPPHPTHPLAGGTVRSRVSLGKGEQTTSVSLGGALSFGRGVGSRKWNVGAHLVTGFSLLSWGTRQARLALRGTSVEPFVSDPALGPELPLAPAPGSPSQGPPACPGAP